MLVQTAIGKFMFHLENIVKIDAQAYSFKLLQVSRKKARKKPRTPSSHVRGRLEAASCEKCFRCQSSTFGRQSSLEYVEMKMASPSLQPSGLSRSKLQFQLPLLHVWCVTNVVALRASVSDKISFVH